MPNSNPFAQKPTESLNQLRALILSAPTTALPQVEQTEIIKVIDTLIFVLGMTPDSLDRLERKCFYPEDNSDKYFLVHFEDVEQLAGSKAKVKSEYVFCFEPIEQFTEECDKYRSKFNDPANDPVFITPVAKSLSGAEPPCLEGRMRSLQKFIEAVPEPTLRFFELMEQARKTVVRKFGQGNEKYNFYYYQMALAIITGYWENKFSADNAYCMEDGRIDRNAFKLVDNFLTSSLNIYPLPLSENGFEEILQHIASSFDAGAEPYPSVLLNRFLVWVFSIHNFGSALLDDAKLLQALINLLEIAGDSINPCYVAAAAGNYELFAFFVDRNYPWYRPGPDNESPLEAAKAKLNESPEDVGCRRIYEFLLSSTLETCETSSSTTDPCVEDLMLSLAKANELPEERGIKFASRINSLSENVNLSRLIRLLILDTDVPKSIPMHLFGLQWRASAQEARGQDAEFLTDPKRCTSLQMATHANPLVAAAYRNNLGLIDDLLQQHYFLPGDEAARCNEFSCTFASIYLGRQGDLSVFSQGQAIAIKSAATQHLALRFPVREAGTQEQPIAYYYFQKESLEEISLVICSHKLNGIPAAVSFTQVALEVYKKDKKRGKELLEELCTQCYPIQVSNIESAIKQQDPELKKILLESVKFESTLDSKSKIWMIHLALDAEDEGKAILWMRRYVNSFQGGKGMAIYQLFEWLRDSETLRCKIPDFMRTKKDCLHNCNLALGHIMMANKSHRPAKLAGSAVEITKFLLEAESLTVTNKMLNWAICNQAYELIEILLPHAEQEILLNAFTFAMVHGDLRDDLYLKIIDSLDENNLRRDVTVCAGGRQSLLTLAVGKERPRLVERLLDRGLDPNFVAVLGLTDACWLRPIEMVFCQETLNRESIKIAGLLLKAGANCCQRDYEKLKLMITQGKISWENFKEYLLPALAKSKRERRPLQELMTLFFSVKLIPLDDLNIDFSFPVIHEIISRMSDEAMDKKNATTLINLMRIPGAAFNTSAKDKNRLIALFKACPEHLREDLLKTAANYRTVSTDKTLQTTACSLAMDWMEYPDLVYRFILDGVDPVLKISSGGSIVDYLIKTKDLGGIASLLNKPLEWQENDMQIETLLARKQCITTLLRKACAFKTDDQEQWDKLGKAVTGCLKKDALVAALEFVHNQETDLKKKSISGELLRKMPGLYDVMAPCPWLEILGQARALEAETAAKTSHVVSLFGRKTRTPGKLEQQLLEIEKIDLFLQSGHAFAASYTM